MLAVRVDATGVVVPVLGGVAVAGGDSGAEAPVLAEGQHVGAVLARNVGGPVSRAVVDDEDVGARNLAPQLREYVGQVVRLVPCRDEDERVVAHSHRPGA
jgi:hypothetical protein